MQMHGEKGKSIARSFIIQNVLQTLRQHLASQVWWSASRNWERSRNAEQPDVVAYVLLTERLLHIATLAI